MSLPEFEIVTTSAGATSIRNNVVNEIMHNPVGPWREANDLYVNQSQLRRRLTEERNEELVLFDVGLGAASNALAAIHAAFGTPMPRRRLHIVSFENNLNLLRFALANTAAFNHMHGFEVALASILNEHHWSSPCGTIVWDLREGDFPTLIAQEKLQAEVVFYDPYSPAVNREMWTLECFQKLRKCCAPLGQPATTIYTYSVSTPVRTAMLLAGFYVGHGISTGLKEETTQAATSLDSLANPLAEKWYGRWLRSETRLPYVDAHDTPPVLIDDIAAHPQLAHLAPLSETLILTPQQTQKKKRRKKRKPTLARALKVLDQSLTEPTG